VEVCAVPRPSARVIHTRFTVGGGLFPCWNVRKVCKPAYFPYGWGQRVQNGDNPLPAVLNPGMSRMCKNVPFPPCIAPGWWECWPVSIPSRGVIPVRNTRLKPSGKWDLMPFWKGVWELSLSSGVVFRNPNGWYSHPRLWSGSHIPTMRMFAIRSTRKDRAIRPGTEDWGKNAQNVQHGMGESNSETGVGE